jgi:hypothetical protein
MSQSPINIPTKSNNIQKLNYNIFLDFKEPEVCLSKENNLDICKKPLIMNTGKLIEIIYDCGTLVMHPHMNGYKCHKIQLHSPSEHKIGIII